MPAADISGYPWDSADPTHAHSYLLPPVLAELSRIANTLPEDRRRLFELGCGNGSVRTLTQLLTEAGFTGIRFVRVGRVPSLAKSMIAIGQRP